ncbi:hypothetical protein C9374_001674 [Naegleria lovaniensis]|uniref:Mitochondrial chaperone BCS1 n=1 Tax=Naegleria lovaniensis TaxID=51637 RepID=A0AA88KRI0_NAELO|nr:uncharacterized protein C9374_001674 [Naegleria lovaniensis]KAG2387342.1 hypothetical protein C9374_001674 [Naegleria lovaniensis]
MNDPKVDDSPKINTQIPSSNVNIKWWKWALAAGAFYLTYELMSEAILPIIERETTLHLSVEQEDEAYHWLMSYFAQHSYTQNCRHLSVLSSDNRAISNVLGGLFGVFGAILASQNETSQHEEHSVLYVPVHGERHFFMYKGKLMWLLIQKIEQGGEKHKPTRESLKLTILSRDKKLLTDLVEEARQLFKEHKKDKTVIYSPSLDCYDWEELTRKPKRPLNSLVLQGNVLEEITSDVKSFVEGSSFYYNRGIPYRRGILLQGPPGTGKSSTVMALAGELGMDIYILNVSSNQLNDEKLSRLLHKVPQNSIVLMEDVDSCQSAVDQSLDQSQRYDTEAHRISVSGLLNSIDGLSAQEGRILFLTTNHPEKLNPALVRPGRVDRKFSISYADSTQVRKLFQNFYQDEKGYEEKMAQHFADKLTRFKQENITPAQLQGYFMKYRGQPQCAIENIRELFEQE